MNRTRSAIRTVLCMIVAMAAVLAGTSVAQATVVSYTVRVKTCDRANADTDGNLHITILGTAGEVPATELDNPGDDRERNRTDEYDLLGEDIGTVTSIILQFRLAGSTDWCLVDVVIVGPHGVTVHPFNNFIRNNANIQIGAA
ncbi:PLAT/LH2 domain-containing protein [Actinosynnema sp. CS-041913]|uniref:PLAT/LH2 domain-containing protein n=1 Tax=Actinosynnema sp. CS-041913 TaxID=3239917 RepID=UPI003D946644